MFTIQHWRDSLSFILFYFQSIMDYSFIFGFLLAITIILQIITGIFLGLHYTYYVVAHFHFVLSLGAVIAIFSGIIFNGEKIVGKNLLSSSSSTLSLYHLVSTFIGILLTFSPMHFIGFNVMPRRIPDFPDYFHSWNFLSSIGSGVTGVSLAVVERAAVNKRLWFASTRSTFHRLISKFL